MSGSEPDRKAFDRPWPGTRRGLCLWLFSLAFVTIGYFNNIIGEQTSVTRDSLAFAFSIAPPVFWGYTMATVGLISAFLSYCHLGRDRYGFVMLAVYSAGWGLVYLCGYLFYDASVRAISGAITWVLFSSILILISGFPNVFLRSPPIALSPEKGD